MVEERWVCRLVISRGKTKLRKIQSVLQTQCYMSNAKTHGTLRREGAAHLGG